MADLSEKDFLLEIQKHNADLKQQIEARKKNLDPDPAAIKARRKRVLIDQDFEFFTYMYFPHHMWLDEGCAPSDFQAFFFNRFPMFLHSKHGARDWFVAPRGEGKSTLMTKIGPIFIVALGLLQEAAVREELGLTETPDIYNDFAIIFGAEAKMPAKLLEVVKTELLSNPSLKMDFPEIMGAGKTWKIGEIVTVNGVRIESKGADQAVRGTFHGASRPKVLLSDDIITDKEAKSPTERDNRWNWIESAIDYLGPPDGTVKFGAVNTVLNNDDPVSRAKNTPGHQVHHFKAIVDMPTNTTLWNQCEEMMRNDDKVYQKTLSDKGMFPEKEDFPSYRFWLKNKRAMSKGAKVSWPSVRDLYTMMFARVKNLRAFNREMQGIARNDDDLVFYEFQFWVNKLNMWIPYGGCDPSMGKGESADPSALTVGFWSREMKKFHVEYCERKKRVPSKLISDLIRLQQHYNCVVWGFENNNAYEYMRTQFIKGALAQKVTLPLRGMTAVLSQIEYIESMEPFVTGLEPQIVFHASCNQLIEEMETFPDKEGHHHYDGLVSLHKAWVAASTGAGGIPYIASSRRRNSQDIRGFGHGR